MITMSFLNDGFSTTIEFSGLPGLKFKEKTVTPPGLDMGGENDTTTMRNTEWRTRQPKQLKTLTNMTVVGSYDSEIYDTAQILSILGVNQEITVTWPDESTLVFWGWCDKATPGEIVEGMQPTMTLEVVPSNEDDSTPPVETAPVWSD